MTIIGGSAGAAYHLSESVYSIYNASMKLKNGSPFLEKDIKNHDTNPMLGNKAVSPTSGTSLGGDCNENGFPGYGPIFEKMKLEFGLGDYSSGKPGSLVDVDA